MIDDIINATAGSALGSTTGGAGFLTSMLPAVPTATAILVSAGANIGMNIFAANKRTKRLEELQERHRLEDKRFQIARDKEHEHFQMEIEANRLSFQEHVELRRLQFQARMEARREEFQEALQSRQIKATREIAQFQAQAMRETQILVSRENAKNLMENQMVLEALKSFPLNISPLVLLNSRPHSLKSLLRYTIDNEENEKDNNQKLITTNPFDVVREIIDYEKNPEALNIFIAPVFVDSRVSNQSSLSKKIWETTYQKIETFFTRNYSRDSKSPVVFYPTAWNEKQTAGVHASETLHYFLKDLPCIVLEPKFDGNKFRMAISFWGLGYASNDHHRMESEFEVIIDLELAKAAYDRSKNALAAIDLITKTNIKQKQKEDFIKLEPKYLYNIELYEGLKLSEYPSMTKEEQKKLFDMLSSLGIDKIFSIDSSKDLDSLANYFADQIGVTLAMLADLHHLMTTRAFPKLPNLMSTKGAYPRIYEDKSICGDLYMCYRDIFNQIREEECSYAADGEEYRRVYQIYDNQLTSIKNQLAVKDVLDTPWKEVVRNIVKENFKYENDDFKKVWAKLLSSTNKKHLEIIIALLPNIDDGKMQKQLERKIEVLKSEL